MSPPSQTASSDLRCAMACSARRPSRPSRSIHPNARAPSAVTASAFRDMPPRGEADSEQMQDLAAAGLGLDYGTVALVETPEKWVVLGAALAGQVAAALHDRIVAVEHIGSLQYPGCSPSRFSTLLSASQAISNPTVSAPYSRTSDGTTGATPVTRAALCSFSRPDLCTGSLISTSFGTMARSGGAT